MTRSFSSLLLCRCVALFALVIPATSGAALQSDDFNRCSLAGSPWSVVDPVGDSIVTLEGAGTADAHLLITVPAGVDHDIWRAGNRAPRLMQAVPDMDFSAEVKFESVPTNRYQMQGMIVEQDGGNFLRFDYYSAGAGLKLFAATFTNGVPVINTNTTVAAVSLPLFMRVTRLGDTWTLAFRTGSSAWADAVAFNHPLNVTSVGPFASNAGTNAPGYTGIIDYFFNTAAPISPEDGSAGGAGTFTLDVLTEGNGAVAVTPDKVAYSCGESVTLQAVPGAGWSFSGWSGDVAGGANPKVVTMVDHTTVTATFLDTLIPPVISNVEVIATDTAAIVSWTTDTASDSVVAYGETTGYELGVVSDAARTTVHTIVLPGLTAGTTYHCQARSETAAGAPAVTGDITFVTDLEAPDPSAITSDDFNRCALDTLVWTVVDPVGDCTVAQVGTGTADAQLIFTVPGGVDHNVWTAGNKAPRLMQPAGDTDFELEVKFESVPAAKYQMQGIIVEEDADDLLRFDVYSSGTQLRVFAAGFVGGAASVYVNQVIAVPGAPLYLRVTRVGDDWTQWYSPDGVSWTEAMTFNHPMTVTAVGPFASNAGTNAPAFTGIVDYFFSTASPVVPEDGAVAGGGLFPLTVTVEGNGTVTATPQKASYACGEVVTLEATSAAGWGFAGWSGDASGAANPLALTIAGSSSVHAVFLDAAVAPVLSGIGITTTDVTATITWQTDLAATSEVAYGLTPSYELGTIVEPTLVTDHSITLTGLLPETVYHLTLSSETSGGGRADSGDLPFTTEAGPPPPPDPSGLQSDDFNACSIDPARWTLVDPVGDASIALAGIGSEDAHLVIGVPAGVDHNVWTGGIRAPRIMQAAADDDLDVAVKFASLPADKYQMQGLIVEQDGGTFLRFDVYSDGSQLRAFAASFANGAPTVQVNQTIIAPTAPIYMRVTRVGDTWTQAYSTDGVAWTEAISFAFPLTVTAVGPFVGNAGASAPGFTGEIDYFFNTAAPVDPEDGAVTGGGTYTLDILLSGAGIVTVTPDKATYSCGETVTLEASADAGWNFAGWSGDLTGTDNPVTFAVTASATITAGFLDMVVPPVLSDVSVSVTDTTATITWDTDVPASSEVAYGLTAAHELPPTVDTTLVRQHSVTLTGLTAGTTHHYEVTSETEGGGLASSGDRLFTTDARPLGLVSDDFNHFNVDPTLWQFVDPRGDAAVWISGTNTADAVVNLHVPGGVCHDIWTAGNFSARLVQPAADVDFQAEVKFESLPSAQYQMQGILVEQDAGNYLRLEFYSSGSRLYVFAARFASHSPAVYVNRMLSVSTGPVYLRVTRQGSTWTLEDSTDGSAWVAETQFSTPLVVSQVGVYAGNDHAVDPPAFTAVVDYFAVTPGFAATDDSEVVTDDTPPLLYHVAATAHRAGPGATIELRWQTDEPADALVDYGLTASYEAGSEAVAGLTQNHVVYLFDLAPDTSYYLRVSSQDANGNLSEYPLMIDTVVSGGPIIDVWYGDAQSFGANGQAQRWVNILGTIADPDQGLVVTYALNGGAERYLDLGPDARRLYGVGDFNVELATADLLEGVNVLQLRAVDAVGDSSVKFVDVSYTAGTTWPLPLAVDWSAAADLLDVAQPVDGLWAIEPEGLRVVEPGYDRLMAIGDVTWSDYEVTVPITVHSIDPAGYAQPSNGPAVGIMLSWAGHTADGRQPSEQYWPFGAIGWYRWNTDWDDEFEIYTAPANVQVADSSRGLPLGVRHIFKMQVTVVQDQLGADVPSYRFKVWEDGQAEPAAWDLSATGFAGDPLSGSMLLVAHHVDATFGNVTIQPVN